MIAHFVYNLFSYSGAAFQAHLLCQNLDRNKQIIFNIGGEKKLSLRYLKGILVVNLPNSYLKRSFYISLLFLAYNVKIVHLHGWVLTGLIPSIFLRRKIILKTTMYNVDDLQAISSSMLNKFLIKSISSVISISIPIKKINEDYIFKHQLKCSSKYIPNGVARLSCEVNFSLEPVFCTVGVVSKRKGTLRAINYFLENYAHLEGAKLYVVGPNPSDSSYAELDFEYYNKCLDMAKKSGGAVELTGKLSKSKVEEIYQQCIAHIFFSEREGLPNVLLESMSFNCVPIVTEIEGVSYDIIDSYKDGFILTGETLESVPFKEISDIRKQGLSRLKVRNKFLLEELSKKHVENYKEVS